METSKPNRISKDGKVKLLSIVVILLLGMEIGQTLRGLENFNGQDNFQLIQVAHALSTPGNFLTFQGKLTDASGNPIATLKNMAFSIYDQLTAGNLVYNETQNVTPDANGIFYVNIGCASASTSNVCTGLSATTGNQTLSPFVSISPQAGFKLVMEFDTNPPASLSLAIDIVYPNGTSSPHYTQILTPNYGEFLVGFNHEPNTVKIPIGSRVSMSICGIPCIGISPSFNITFTIQGINQDVFTSYSPNNVPWTNYRPAPVVILWETYL